jgi:hypothetical protein
MRVLDYVLETRLLTGMKGLYIYIYKHVHIHTRTQYNFDVRD